MGHILQIKSRLANLKRLGCPFGSQDLVWQKIQNNSAGLEIKPAVLYPEYGINEKNLLNLFMKSTGI